MHEENSLNETLKVVIVGHVDHGKSTLIGRIMYDLGQIKDGKYDELVSVSKKRGETFEWAYLMDSFQTERNQGITIDTTQTFFKTQKRNYILIDAPGHKEFLRNMITGASSADIATLIVDVNEGVKEQTKKHGYLLKLLGLSKVIVVINKMDKVSYNKDYFLKVKNEITNYLNLLSVDINQIIPISAREGENIYKKSKKMPWYSGYNVIEAFDKHNLGSISKNLPLRLPVQDIYKINDKRIIVGKIESGEISSGDEVFFSPSSSAAYIKSIEVWGSKKDHAFHGECIGLTIDDEIFVERGNIISTKKSPPKLVNNFEANIFWLSDQALEVGKNYLIRITSGEYRVKIEGIKKIINTNDLSHKINKKVLKNEVAEVTLYSQFIIPVDDFSDNAATSRFSIIENFNVVGGGIINSKNYPDQREKNIEGNKNIVPTNFAISETDRTLKLKHRPGIIWFTGLSGSGKSTIAKEIEKRLFFKGYNIFILDGDNLRLGLNKDLNFSPEDRMENIRRTSEVAALFANAGFLVIAALISPYKSERKKARSIRPEIFREVYIKSSIEKCLERDVKGLYAKAKRGKIKYFTGLSAPYEEPDEPDLILNTEKKKINPVVKELERFIVKEFGIL